jgi:arabinoxylan arabinofuranohydrolase
VTAELTGASGVHDVYFTYDGPAGEDLVEVDSLSFAARTGELPVTVSAQTRCIAGKAYVAVQASNGHDEPVDVVLRTSYGERPVADVAPGANAYQSFSTRAASVAAGSATVRATGTIDGVDVTTVRTAEYAGIACTS